MAKTYEKRALVTGLGMGYFQFMKTEETPSTAPAYDETCYEVPSLQKASVELEIAEHEMYLSNTLHSNPSAVKKLKITLDAGYLPSGFAEEAQGMVKLDEGAWGMPTKPIKKPFRMAFPITDDKGGVVVVNIPKCTLSPVNISVETEGDDSKEQIGQYNITGVPMTYFGTSHTEKPTVYYKVDLSVESAAKAYDMSKLLEVGFYNKATLDAAKKTASATVSPSGKQAGSSSQH